MVLVVTVTSFHLAFRPWALLLLQDTFQGVTFQGLMWWQGLLQWPIPSSAMVDRNPLPPSWGVVESNLLSSSGSPRFGFSSRLSSADDLDDPDCSCPFDFDDVDESGLQYRSTGSTHFLYLFTQSWSMSSSYHILTFLPVQQKSWPEENFKFYITVATYREKVTGRSGWSSRSNAEDSTRLERLHGVNVWGSARRFGVWHRVWIFHGSK